MNRFAIFNVDKGQFLTPIDGTDVFRDKVELAEFLTEQKRLHNLDDISHLRVVSVMILRNPQSTRASLRRYNSVNGNKA